MNWKQMCDLFPEGVNTLSKRPCVHAKRHPEMILRGDGCRVWASDGNEYVDWSSSLGAVILGHAYPAVVDAITKQVKEGTLFSMEHPLCGELASLIRDVVPSMERMRFLKTGSESCQAAVRIARAYTGKWPIACSGYHGWHEWYNQTTPKNAGSVAQDVTPLKWGDVKVLEQFITDRQPAAYILEPYIYEDEKTVKAYLQQVRSLCTHHGVVLIFDENVTGFRTKKMTAQECYGIRPELTCLGKAIANGVPMACVGGKKEIMDVLKGDCFVSGTFLGDLIGVSAAIATIKIIKEKPVYITIESVGEKIKTVFNQSIRSIMRTDEAKAIGQPQRTHFIFPTPAHKGLFFQYCLEQGIWFDHAQFPNFSHDHFWTDRTMQVIRESIYRLNKHWDNPSAALDGPPPGETLRMVTVPAKQEEAIKEFEQAQNVIEEPPKKKRGRPRKNATSSTDN